MSGHRSRCAALILAACAALASCGVLDPEPEEDTCSAGEFLSLGCAIVQGIVTDSAGAPLSGISVGPRYGEDRCCTTNYSTTGPTGEYSFKIDRVSGLSPDDPVPYTVSMHVIAGRAGVGWLISVPKVVTFGGRPVVNEVNITMPGME